MESINFNDFSQKECYEIITAFLIKMRKAKSMQSAENFYDYYLKKFYRVPFKLLNDIVYCQRAMRTHLSMHQTIVRVFSQDEEADPVAKQNYLQELENILYELNAESQYLMLRLQDNIDIFCLPFTEQQLQPNEQLLRAIVSSAVVPLVCAAQLKVTPYYVLERLTEQQLLRRYFTISPEEQEHRYLQTIDISDEEPAAPKEAAKPTSTAFAPPVSVKAAVSPEAVNDTSSNVVKTSRLNLQAALKRARSQHLRGDKEDKPSAPAAASASDKIMEAFMRSLGLCNHSEHTRIVQVQKMARKRKTKASNK